MKYHGTPVSLMDALEKGLMQAAFEPYENRAKILYSKVVEVLRHKMLLQTFKNDATMPVFEKLLGDLEGNKPPGDCL